MTIFSTLMDINMNTWRESVISSPKRIAIPIMTHPGIDLIGCRVIDAVTNGEIHYRAIKTLSEAYPTAACCTIMDLTVEAEAFGSKILFSENAIPSVDGRLLQDSKDAERLHLPKLDAARLPEIIKACTLAADHISNRPVLGGVIGPYSLAGRLYGMTELMIGCMCEPDTIHRLLGKCTEFLIAYCTRLRATGINGLVMAEPAAGLISADDCMTFSSSYIRQIVETIQDDNFIFILHNCGTSGHCAQAMVDTGAHALHFGNKADMVEVLKKVPSDVLVMGNLSPVEVFLQSSPEKVFEETMTLLNKTAEYPNFILSSGCDVPPHVPKANIDSFFKALETYNRNQCKS